MVAWVLHQPGVTSALVGARTVAQATENADAGRLQLQATDLAAIRRVFSAVKINKRPGRSE